MTTQAEPPPGGSDEAIEALSRQLFADYDSEFDASYLSWQDFEGQAQCLLAIVEPVIAARVHTEAAAAERQRVLGLIEDRIIQDGDGSDRDKGRLSALLELQPLVAAGSVPVVTRSMTA